MIKYCACGEEAKPVILPEFKYQGKIIKNVPAFECLDSKCEFGRLSFKSEVIEKVEEIIKQGKDTFLKKY